MEGNVIKFVIVTINLLFFGIGFLYGHSLKRDRDDDVRQTRANTKLLLNKLGMEEP